MVLAGKIFKIRENVDLDYVAAKLKGFKKEEKYAENEREFKLLAEIQDLSMKKGILRGTFADDKMIHVKLHGDLMPVPRTVEAQFTFSENKDRILLTILEKKWQANSIANQLSEILFISVGQIVEARIPPTTLRRYHEENPDGTKVIFFDDVDIPNINKLSLYGPDLARASLYSEYLKHGAIWYAVMTSKKSGFIAGITRNAIVTVFNRIDPSDFLDYVAEEIFPLIE